MNTRLLLLAVFAAGLCLGWFGNSWLKSEQSTTSILDIATTQNRNTPTDYQLDPESTVNGSSTIFSNTNNAGIHQPASQVTSNTASITDTFNNLLQNKQYQEAINLYQEQKRQNTQIAPHLRTSLIHQLEVLAKASNSDFSSLIELYLSVYYDDVDALLLLADFNQTNGHYLEVVDVYLLAKTYAYSEIDQQTVLNRFNIFTENVDNSYTNQRNWWSLINFYSHVNTSGLMTSTHQYQQALAYLRSGDETFAIEQFNQLVTDSVVGDSAALTLGNLDNHTTAPAIDDNSTLDHAESIALQKTGNQFAVDLTNNRQDSVRLLIDTGASMTAISSASSSSFNIISDAIAQDRRVFQTAGGVVMGTVYTVPELRLGTYLLHDTQVAVIDFETDREIDGLLGMNILGLFRFQIDQENTQLHLTKK